jgi:hypothetical protein
LTDLHDKLTNRSPAQTAMDAWPLPPGEPIKGKTYMADGWTYGDLPRMAPAFFDQFVEIVGAENLRWLTLANYGGPNGPSKRGQYLMSPEGQDRLREYAHWAATEPSPTKGQSQ